MFNKTTSLAFQKYGMIINTFPNTLFNKVQHKILRIQNKTIDRLSCYSNDTTIHVDKGIVLLLVSELGDGSDIERFVIHRNVKIRKGVYFNFITLSNESKIIMARNINIKKTVVNLSEPLAYEKITPTFMIKEIFAYYYQVRNAGYEFSGEQHNYWELTYIDNGTLLTSVNGEDFELNGFDLLLYAPKQYHKQRTLPNQSCSCLTIMFDMNCIAVDILSNRIFNCQKSLASTLNNFIKTSNSVESPYSHDLLICYLKELIIKLLQYDEDDSNVVSKESVQIQQHFESELLNEIIMFIDDNIYKPLAIDELCYEFSISRSSLQALFKENLKIAPKQYINELKLKKSKLLIKEGKYTINEISLMIGFGSIHYFSRKFKQRYKLSPTDYAKSIYN